MLLNCTGGAAFGATNEGGVPWGATRHATPPNETATRAYAETVVKVRDR